MSVDNKNIAAREFKGAFWKPCPGTTQGYLCCNYQILTPHVGCGMYCSYCILQSYFTDSPRAYCTNWDDLEREVARKMAAWKGVVRFGTGEFADSLYFDRTVRVAPRLSRFLKRFPRACIEFKTKSTVIETLEEIDNRSQVIIGFSMNTPRMIGALEHGTASLEERLAAARQCVEMGFWVAFHFDPMIYYTQWEVEYHRVVDAIFTTLGDARRIAWWSMGGFRCMPSLKRKLRGDPYYILFSPEQVLGADKKLRYFRPVRSSMYRSMQQKIAGYDPRVTLYLCMESPEVWEESGMAYRIPQGLGTYLEDRARVMLTTG